MQWYYANNGTQNGPVTQEELAALLANGSLGWNTLIWCDGMPDWLPASSVPQFQMSVVAGAPPLPQQPFAPNPYSPPLAPANFAGGGELVPNYLWQSILVTFFCCLPFGIVAIVYAAKVDGLLQAGDRAGAQQASASARTWCMVSFWLVAPFVILWFILMLMGVVGGAVSHGGGY